MSDLTLKVQKTAEQLAEEKAQAMQDLANWYDCQAKLEKLKADELAYRNKVVQYFFPDGLKEGVNKCDMPEGWELKVTGKINRKVQPELIATVTKELEDLQKRVPEDQRLTVSDLVRYKPELSLTDYKKLIEQVKSSSGDTQYFYHQLLSTFDQLLVMTDGTPSVELLQPKKPKVKVSAL